jgi:hypothetical protein
MGDPAQELRKRQPTSTDKDKAAAATPSVRAKVVDQAPEPPLSASVLGVVLALAVLAGV